MKRQGFTLIQLVIVLVILTIIIGIVVSVGGGPRRGPVERSTKAEMKVLDGLMLEYEADGNTPITAATNTDPATIWVKALRNDPKTAPQIKPLKSAGSGDNTKILDTFGTPIELIPADPAQKKPAYFRSAGPDGQMGTPDDLFSDGG